LRIPSYLKPSIGGLLTGVVGFSFVSFGIMGVGYEGIEMALFGKLTLRLLLMLFILKIVATSLTIGSGSSGGVFAPSLYIGAMLGGFLGTVFNMFDSSIRPEAYVLLGMGAFFAAVGKAPLTCMVMIPEMSGDYRMIAPLMASIILSYAVSSMFLGKSSIYTLKLERKGVYKPHPPILEEFENIKVRDIMTPNPVTVSPEMPISKVFDYIARHKKLGYPVMHGGKVVGLLSFNRIRYYNKPLENLKVKNLMLHPPTVTPETSVYEVFEKLTDKEGGRVCVVENGRLVGIVTKTDILKAYNIAKKILEDEERLSTEIRKRLKKLVGRIT
ncbi:MAG: chloride channel protein, partial [Candidatus Methanofastidiosia archaeon]